MNEPPSSWLPPAADLLSQTAHLTTAGQLLAGAVLLLLSAALKTAAKLIERRAPFDGLLPEPFAAEPERYRLGARTAQYLALLAAAAVVMAPRPAADGVPGWAPVALTALLFLLYLGAAALAGAFAARRPLGALAVVRGPLRAWCAAAAPLLRLALRIDGRLRPERDEPGAADARERLAAVLEEGGLEPDELDLVRNVLAFHERTAADLMVPRPDVEWVSARERVEEALERVEESGHSRFPLIDGSADDVVGYVHARDLIFARSTGGEVDLATLARPVAFVPEQARAGTLLRRFQREGSHLGVVVDEFGGISGLVTLEDVLEELVGEIRDEFDPVEADLRSLANGDTLVDGGVRLEELERSLGLAFGDPEEDTVGGYIFGRLAREVAPGDEVTLAGARLRVEGVEGLRVTLVRVIPERHHAPTAQPEPV